MGEKNSRFNGDTKALSPPVEPHAAPDADTAEVRTLRVDEFVDELAETGEFPPLVVGADEHRPSGSAQGRASFVLTHLESEIGRLQARWERVESELRAREAVIDELKRAVDDGEAVAADLRNEAAKHEAQSRTAAQQITDANARIEKLEAAKRALESVVAERDGEIATRRGTAEAADRKLAESAAEIGRLTAQIEGQRDALAAAEQREAAGAGEATRMRATIVELETYIDGRKHHWAQLNDKLAEYQDALLGLQRETADRDARLEATAAEKLSLAEKIVALEQRAGDLEHRLRERETALGKRENEITEHGTAATRLHSELAETARERDEALGRLATSQATAAELERSVAERDTRLGELRGDLAATRDAKDNLIAQRDASRARVSELESLVTERDAKIAALLEASRAGETALAKAEKRTENLDKLLAEAGKEMTAMQEAQNAEERRVARLRQQVQDKQHALDLLERSAQRLDDLGASLEGFDRRFSAAPEAEVLSAQVRAVENPAPSAVTIGPQQPASTARRRMIVAIEGNTRTTYPLRGSDITIGRSAQSDIRLRSPFISRLHARISVRDDDALIEDLGSKNGILLNSNPIGRSAALHNGDIISLGGLLELKYVDRDEAVIEIRPGAAQRPQPAPPPR